MSSPEADYLGRVVSWITQVTGVHRLSLPTSSMTFWSTVERAKFDAQSGYIPLWDGLNIQALWFSMLPLTTRPSVFFYFASLPSSLFLSLCVQSSSQGLPFHFSISRLQQNWLTDYSVSIHGFSHLSQCLFGSSSASMDSPSAAALGVPYSASSSALREWPLVLL